MAFVLQLQQKFNNQVFYRNRPSLDLRHCSDETTYYKTLFNRMTKVLNDS